MDELTTSIKARISLTMFDALQKLSGRDCVPVSHLVRTALRLFLASNVSQQGHKRTRSK
jgi:hypothetical protein